MRRFMIAAIAILALAALVAGVLGFLLRGSPNPTVGLSSSTVHAGDSLTVTASHLPANQAGEIHLLSVLRIFPFSADGAGNVSAVIAVPTDIEVGDHTLSICWAGTCHSSTTLVVTAPLAVPSPSPTPTPPSITLSASSVRIGGQLTVSGHNFDPSKRATVLLYQGATPRNLVSPPIAVAADGTFVVRVRIPSSARPGGAEIVACIYSGVAAQPTSGQCGAKAVLIAR
jgi:hypothetical protein